VTVSQIATVMLTIISAIVTFYMDTIAGAWKLLIVTGAGTGTVLILRWFWWRINAWSEVSAMASALVVSVSLQTVWGISSADPRGFAIIMLITVGITTAVWLTVTLTTAPEPQETLVAFYRRVRPAATFWKPVARLAPDVPASSDMKWNALDWACGCIMIYGALFGTGKLILGEPGQGLLFLAASAAAAAVIYWDLNRRGWKTAVE
jgi:solute:Na+ symporter, SSS family